MVRVLAFKCDAAKNFAFSGLHGDGYNVADAAFFGPTGGRRRGVAGFTHGIHNGPATIAADVAMPIPCGRADAITCAQLGVVGAVQSCRFPGTVTCSHNDRTSRIKERAFVTDIESFSVGRDLVEENNSLRCACLVPRPHPVSGTVP